jgi:hypothetical protein
MTKQMTRTRKPSATKKRAAKVAERAVECAIEHDRSPLSSDDSEERDEEEEDKEGGGRGGLVV